MSSLDRVTLNTNQLTGEIPRELGNLPRLAVLTLSSNDLTGSIPAELGNVPHLYALAVGSNRLSGPIPASLVNPTALSILDVSFNSGLTGPLPAWDEAHRFDTLDLHGTSVCVARDAGWADRAAAFHPSGLECAVSSDPVPVIDVAVFYTPAARETEGGTEGIEAVIDLMVAETNQAFEDSGAEQQIALVAVEEVRYRENESSLIDLRRLTNPADGYLDEVHAVRELTGADLVHLIVGEGSVCGVANPVPRQDKAFGLTYLACGGLTFAHELGHGMGSCTTGISSVGGGQPATDPDISPTASGT